MRRRARAGIRASAQTSAGGRAKPIEWGRRKLLTLLVGAAVLALALLVGLGLSVYYTLQPDRRVPPEDDVAASDHTGGARDEIAARPMTSVPPGAARPGPLTTEPFKRLVLPSPRRLGPAGVSTGFPQTAGGALAQLVAIDQAALQSASVPGAQTVIGTWAVPGGPTAESWSGVRAIAELLAAAGLPASGSPTLTISAAPELGLIKGTVGPAFVVACVDFVVTATVTTTARVAAADCQRMIWTTDPNQSPARSDGQVSERDVGEGRWLIGPGPEPARPPSVWPGTQAAHSAGYRVLTYD